MVQDYYPSMLTIKHKNFIDTVEFRYRQYNDLTVKYSIEDLQELLILDTECVLKPKSMCDV